jgi:protein involved in polysaccharide export with SLBB domain
MVSCLLGLALAAATAHSLEIPALLGKKFMDEVDKDAASDVAGNDSPDNSIDPERYIVGGGDAFQISFVGLPSQDFNATINPEGNLYIRDFGILPLGRVTLAEAKNRIKAFVEKSMKGRYQAYVTLKRIKKPVVNVGGIVSSPGTYTAAGTMRLLDALKMANKSVLPSFETADFRQVERRNGDSVATFDILKYLAGKDPGQNPYLYPGDQITLHGLDRFVIVKGAIDGPVEGKLPLRPGESLGDVLNLVHPKASMDSGYILVRHAGGSAEPARKASWSEAASIPLADRDVITVGVKENFEPPATATVEGEAVRPGTYPIIDGVTPASEVLSLAGGVRGNGNLHRAFIIKRGRILRDKDKLESKKAKDALPAPAAPDNVDMAMASLRKVRPEMSSSLNDLNVLSDYMIIDLGDDPSKVVLEADDRLVIPKRSPFVYVSGSVRNPGAYAYRPGKDYRYYVEQAGGLSDKADKANAFLVTPYDNTAKIRDMAGLREGDVIVIPASIEYKTFNNVILPIIQVLPGVLSLLLTIILVQKQ